MALFPQTFIDDLKHQADIVTVIQDYVSLKKTGATYKGLCPFHGEKTPSFTVTPARESWKCFGCGLGGDVFSFVMQREGVGFREALQLLAELRGEEPVPDAVPETVPPPQSVPRAPDRRG